MTTKTCCMCGDKIDGWGCNPQPFPYKSGDVCCKPCDDRFVIPMRMIRLAKGRSLRSADPSKSLAG